MSLTLAELAAHKLLPEWFLKDLGLEDLGAAGVGIPYYSDGGETIAVKRRTSLVAKDGSYWPKGRALAAYGIWKLADAHRTGKLFLVEGESDCWTLWYASLPALGIPGSNATKVVEKAHLESVEQVFIHREPGNGGDQFVAGLVRRLRELGFEGDVWEFACSKGEDGAKDPSALHCLDPDRFLMRFHALAREAKPPEVAAVWATPVNGNGNGHAPPQLGEGWPEPMKPEAFFGLAGEIVKKIEPETEADPIAILTQFLLCFGSACGRSPHRFVESRPHFVNEFGCLVGRTGKSRKGTSMSRVESVLAASDEAWYRDCIHSGLSSGEGLIHVVRDAGENGDGGAKDKRALVIEEELAQVLRCAQRDNNTLTMVLRQGWDSGRLRTMTKNSPFRATGAHISLIGHITRDELLRCMTQTDMANGFANRFLWVCVKRSKFLPDGGQKLDLSTIAAKVAACLDNARTTSGMGRDTEATALWYTEYARLSAEREGMFGLVTNRAEAHVLRLSMIYALLDYSAQIKGPHLRAALAFWDYCERSCRYIFGDAVGDEEADKILDAVKASRQLGMSRTEISQLFRGHRTVSSIQRALDLLSHAGRAHKLMVANGDGRPSERWFYGCEPGWGPSNGKNGGAENAKEAKEEKEGHE